MSKPSLDADIRVGERAMRRIFKGRDDIRAAMPIAARGLLSAKLKYSATQDFGQWLTQSPYARLGKTDRAALLNLAKHEGLSEIELVLRTTTSTSPEVIWGECQTAMNAMKTAPSSEIRKSAPPGLEPELEVRFGSEQQRDQRPPQTRALIVETPPKSTRAPDKILGSADTLVQIPLLPGEKQVIMFGEHYWPRVDLGFIYSYADLTNAISFFLEADKMARDGDASPQSRAMRVRGLIACLGSSVDPRVSRLIVSLTRDLERNPDGPAPNPTCRAPMYRTQH